MRSRVRLKYLQRVVLLMGDYWNSELRTQVLARDGRTCQRCGTHEPDIDRTGKKDSALHVHHKTPRSEGGTDEMSNLETLCYECHAEEHWPPNNLAVNIN